MSPEMVGKNDQGLIEYLLTMQSNAQAQSEVTTRLLRELANQLNLRPTYAKIQKELVKALKPVAAPAFRVYKTAVA